MILALIVAACVLVAWAMIAWAVVASNAWRAWHGEGEFGWDAWPEVVEALIVTGVGVLAVVVAMTEAV